MRAKLLNTSPIFPGCPAVLYRLISIAKMVGGKALPKGMWQLPTEFSLMLSLVQSSTGVVLCSTE